MNKPPVTDRRVTKGEDAVAGFLKEEGPKSLSEISTELGYTVAATTRFLRRLVDSGQVRVSGASRHKVYEWAC